MMSEQEKLLVHALVDGELDAGHAHDVETHIANCADCAAEFARVRDLRDKMKSVDLRFAAPDDLLGRLERALPKQPQPVSASRRDILKGAGFGVGLSAIAASGLFIMVARNDTQDRILNELVSAHFRSLQADHLTDVLTSDRHTVKPWFNGRVDVAPPVEDLTAQGFTLIGGRLDAIDGKAVAAIVYRRANHVINLFVAPAATESRTVPRTETARGVNCLHWLDQGLSLWAVSDINPDELQKFREKFEAALHEKA
jgi:anti-sigma factor RsiW